MGEEVNVRQNELVSGDLLNDAFSHWLLAAPDEWNYIHIVQGFKALIGNADFLCGTYTVTPERAQILRGMTGPHAHTYCKMLLAQRSAPCV
jgi:hypothetical protein